MNFALLHLASRASQDEEETDPREGSGSLVISFDAHSAMR